MKNSIFTTGCVAVLALLFTACSKDPLNNLTADESRIYITNYDTAANFSVYKTFSVSDSVTALRNGAPTRELTAVDRAFIAAARSRMQAKGYTEVGKNSNPDLGINITRISNTATGVLVFDNFYGGYGGFYDPFYWGYGGFGYMTPFSYGTYTIREGALSMDMLDLKNAQANNNNIEIIWNGLIRGSGIFNADAAAQVKILFDQSPYLQTN